MKNSSDDLVQLLCSLTTPEDMYLLLQGLLSNKEQDDIEKRLKIFKMLEKGTSQRQIASQLGVGIATVTRGAQAYKHQAFAHLLKQCHSKASSLIPAQDDTQNEKATEN